MRAIPDPGFAGDDGRADPELAAALEVFDRDPDATYAATLAVVQDARLLVPVLAVSMAGDTGAGDGEGTVDMATVLMRGRDGRAALLAFTGTEALRRWDPSARPVPVSVPTTAASALQDGADALVLDVAGPVRFVVEGADLGRLAAGERLVLDVLSGSYAWARPGP